jgi:hypothetical protein
MNFSFLFVISLHLHIHFAYDTIPRFPCGGGCLLLTNLDEHHSLITPLVVWDAGKVRAKRAKRVKKGEVRAKSAF